MSVLRRARPGAAPVVEERGQRIAVSGGGYFSMPGIDVSSDPLRSVAHWAARRVLCTSIAGLPVIQVRESSSGRVRLSPSQIVSDPDGTGDAEGWVYQVMDSWLDAGNVYGDIVAMNSMGLPTQVEIIPPEAVAWQPVEGRLEPFVYGVHRPRWPMGDLWHVAAYRRAGSPVGLSPTEAARQGVQTAIAAERFGRDFFSFGHPTHDVAATSSLTKEQAFEIKEALRRSWAERSPFVHGADLTVKPMMVNPSDSQFIELLRFECEQAARVYGVPPQMIYAATSGQSVTYANASQSDLNFLKYSLLWWVRRLQGAWSRFLPSPQVVRFNTDAFLQMTALERAQLHDIRLKQKSRTVDEVRMIEDEEPFGGEYALPGIPTDSPDAPDTPDDEEPAVDPVDLMDDGGAADD